MTPRHLHLSELAGIRAGTPVRRAGTVEQSRSN